MRVSINRQMILQNLFYFLQFSIVGASLPFVISLMKDAGLTTFQAEMISELRNIFACVCLLWSVLADYTGRRRLLFIIINMGTIMCLASMLFVSYHVCEVKTIANQTLSSIFTTTDDSTSFYINATGTIEEILVDENCRTKQLYIFMSFMFASACFDQAHNAFSDALVVNFVTTSKSPHSFGIQKSFGSMGFGISSLLVGIAIDNNNIDDFPKYGPASLVIVLAGIFIMPAVIAKVSSFATKENLYALMIIVSIIQFSVGNFVANMLGGYLYDELGGRLMYRYASLVFAALTIMLLI